MKLKVHNLKFHKCYLKKKNGAKKQPSNWQPEIKLTIIKTTTEIIDIK